MKASELRKLLRNNIIKHGDGEIKIYDKKRTKDLDIGDIEVFKITDKATYYIIDMEQIDLAFSKICKG